MDGAGVDIITHVDHLVGGAGELVCGKRTRHVAFSNLKFGGREVAGDVERFDFGVDGVERADDFEVLDLQGLDVHAALAFFRLTKRDGAIGGVDGLDRVGEVGEDVAAVAFDREGGSTRGDGDAFSVLRFLEVDAADGRGVRDNEVARCVGGNSLVSGNETINSRVGQRLIGRERAVEHELDLTAGTAIKGVLGCTKLFNRVVIAGVRQFDFAVRLVECSPPVGEGRAVLAVVALLEDVGTGGGDHAALERRGAGGRPGTVDGERAAFDGDFAAEELRARDLSKTISDREVTRKCGSVCNAHLGRRRIDGSARKTCDGPAEADRAETGQIDFSSLVVGLVGVDADVLAEVEVAAALCDCGRVFREGDHVGGGSRIKGEVVCIRVDGAAVLGGIAGKGRGTTDGEVALIVESAAAETGLVPREGGVLNVVAYIDAIHRGAAETGRNCAAEAVEHAVARIGSRIV